MYIGKEPIVGNFQKCDAITVVNGQAAYTLQVSSTNVVPESANHMLVSLNGVLQSPITSFTVSGSTLTFASNLATGDVIDFVILLGNVLDIGIPSDDSVTLAKMAAGTDGQIITYDASGNPTAVGPGSDGQVLTSTGAGSPPAFEAAPGGAWVKILQQTASTSSSIEFKHGTSGVVIDSTYRAYCIVYTDCYASTQHTISVQVSPDTGSSYDTSGYYWVRHTVNYNGGSQSVTNATGTGELMLLNQHGSTLNTGGNGIIYIFSPSNSSSKTTGISYALECSDGSNYIRHQQVVGIHDTAEAIDAFRILPSTGTINGGVFTLYGLTP